MSHTWCKNLIKSSRKAPQYGYLDKGTLLNVNEFIALSLIVLIDAGINNQVLFNKM